MTLTEYIEEIKLEISGGILHLELTDEQIAKIVKKSLRELQRYVDETRFMTIPFARCIDLSGVYDDGTTVEDDPGDEKKNKIKISSISRIYRTEGYSGSTETNGMETTIADPMYAQTWMAFTNGSTMYNLTDYLYNYMSYNTLLQLRNTTTTDLAFTQDHQGNKLYINCYDSPSMITIEYIPVFQDVSEIKTDYWTDILLRLSVAQTKLVLGRIRSRYKQTNALWEQDGDTLLTEANEELKTLRETLRVNSMMIYPVD